MLCVFMYSSTCSSTSNVSNGGNELTTEIGSEPKQGVVNKVYLESESAQIVQKI